MNKIIFAIIFALFTIIDAKFSISIMEDDESSLIKAIEKSKEMSGIIYINTSVININSTNTLLLNNKEIEIIGIIQANGAYPRINFKNARKNGSTANGITITGNNFSLKFLIIENAGGNGIYITGRNNVLKNIITRYNNGSGILLSGASAGSNKLTNCYSYRNVNIREYGRNASGFSQLLGSTNNIFENCFAWDNSDNGFDLFDKEGKGMSKAIITHSGSWNNGNADVFTGKYDYDNNKPLDKNLWTIQELISTDPNFESNYINKKFSITNGKMGNIDAISWYSKGVEKMQGIGFNLGSNINRQENALRRIVESVSFDHKSVGFLSNTREQKYTVYFQDLVSFNNDINYQLPYNFQIWENNWSWNPKTNHQNKQNSPLNYPVDKNKATEAFYAIRDKIVKNCEANIFDDNVSFVETIKKIL